MALFKCRACGAVYEDYYPPDDSCLECKKGTVRIIISRQILDSTRGVDKYAGAVDKSQKCNMTTGSLTFCTLNRHDT